jgi:hypothetical protein
MTAPLPPVLLTAQDQNIESWRDCLFWQTARRIVWLFQLLACFSEQYFKTHQLNVSCINHLPKRQWLGYVLGRLRNWGSILGRGKRSFSSAEYPDQLWAPPRLPSNAYSPASSADIKNDGVIPPLSHTFSWHGA